MTTYLFMSKYSWTLYHSSATDKLLTKAEHAILRKIVLVEVSVVILVSD